MTLQSTVASIQNIRKQRQLELELVELDRLWHLELKALARERLGLIKELCRIRQDRRGADHFPANCTHSNDLTHLADNAQARLRRVKEAKELRKFDFQPDPVEKMHLTLPLLPSRGEVVEVRTAKELYKERVNLQKSNVEQCTADRRSRRRPFWDKALLGSKKRHPAQHHQQHQQQQPDRLVSFPLRIRNLGPADQVLQDSQRITEEQQEEEDLRRREGLSKSPSLPALNTLRRFDSLKPPRKIHPSLSNRHSASLDYLPVIKSIAPRGQHAVLPPLKAAAAAPSVASSVTTLPTIEET